MDLGGLSMENFPPVAGNDTKTLRKLSLLEARMVGAGNESRDASLPPNDGSRGSENNSSNSMSTIGFPKPRYVVASPDGGSQSNARRRTPGVGGQGLEHADDGKGSGKRKAMPRATRERRLKPMNLGKRAAHPTHTYLLKCSICPQISDWQAPSDGTASPYRPPLPSHSSGTSDTQSTSPGESRDLSTTHIHVHRGEDGPGSKRARAGGIPLHPQSQPPLRPPAPQHDCERQTPQGVDSSAHGILRAQQGQGRRISRVTDGGASPAAGVPPSGKSEFCLHDPAPRHSSEGVVGRGRDQIREVKFAHGAPPHLSSDVPCGGGLASGGDGIAQSPAALTPGMGPESSPLSSVRGGKSGAAGYIAGGGHGGPAGVTKTIQSYFLKPSNGLAVQALAASYGGEPAEGMVIEGVESPKEVYLSGADDESLQGAERIQSRAVNIGDKTSPTARASLTEGVSLHQGFVNVASGDQSGGQAPGQKPFYSRGQGDSDMGSSRRGQDEKTKAQTNPAHVPQITPEEMENALGKLKEAENLAKRLQKDLDRANLERSGMESMLTTLQTQLDSKINDLKTHEEERQKHRKQLTSVIESLLRKVSAQEASDCRAKLARDSLQLGKIVSVKTGHIGKYVEAFEEGSLFKDVEIKLAALVSTRSKLEGRKRAVANFLEALEKRQTEDVCFL